MRDESSRVIIPRYWVKFVRRAEGIGRPSTFRADSPFFHSGESVVERRTVDLPAVLSVRAGRAARNKRPCVRCASTCSFVPVNRTAYRNPFEHCISKREAVAEARGSLQFVATCLLLRTLFHGQHLADRFYRRRMSDLWSVIFPNGIEILCCTAHNLRCGRLILRPGR